MTKKQSQAGFTMVELMVSTIILLLVMSTAFELMNSVQTRKRVEEERVDIIEESRDFVDELSRDLRNSGYPQGRMYACGSYVPGAGAQGTGTVVGVNCS